MKGSKTAAVFGQDGRPLNRQARRALEAMDKRFRKNKARRGEAFAARRLAEQAEQLKSRAVVLGALPPPTMAERWREARAARTAAVTAAAVESLPEPSEGITAKDAPVKALAPGDAVLSSPAPRPGRSRAARLKALAPADAAEVAG